MEYVSRRAVPFAYDWYTFPISREEHVPRSAPYHGCRWWWAWNRHGDDDVVWLVTGHIGKFVCKLRRCSGTFYKSGQALFLTNNALGDGILDVVIGIADTIDHPTDYSVFCVLCSLHERVCRVWGMIKLFEINGKIEISS